MGKLTDRIFYDFELHKLGYDFMGYTFDNKDELSYHHIKPRKLDGETTYKNGAILNRFTSHNYIHVIEDTDFKLFLEISQILKDEHKCKAITKEHLVEIRRILEFFEKKYENKCTSKGLLIIKEDFVRRRIRVDE